MLPLPCGDLTFPTGATSEMQNLHNSPLFLQLSMQQMALLLLNRRTNVNVPSPGKNGYIYTFYNKSNIIYDFGH
jgi:hypothetical protein